MFYFPIPCLELALEFALKGNREFLSTILWKLCSSRRLFFLFKSIVIIMVFCGSWRPLAFWRCSGIPWRIMALWICHKLFSYPIHSCFLHGIQKLELGAINGICRVACVWTQWRGLCRIPNTSIQLKAGVRSYKWSKSVINWICSSFGGLVWSIPNYRVYIHWQIIEYTNISFERYYNPMAWVWLPRE